MVFLLHIFWHLICAPFIEKLNYAHCTTGQRRFLKFQFCRSHPSMTRQVVRFFLQITLYSYCILFGSEFCTFQRKSKNTQVEKCQFNSPRIVALASAGRPGCQTRKKIKSLGMKSNSLPPLKGAKMQQLGSLVFALQPESIVCQCQCTMQCQCKFILQFWQIHFVIWTNSKVQKCNN